MSEDVQLRVRQPNDELSKWTKGKGPWTLLWRSDAISLSDARKLEIESLVSLQYERVRKLETFSQRRLPLVFLQERRRLSASVRTSMKSDSSPMRDLHPLGIVKACALGLLSLALSCPCSQAAGWESVESGTTVTLYTIRSGPNGMMYAAGDGATLIQYSGTSWTTASGWNTADFEALAQERWANHALKNIGVDKNGNVYVGCPTDSHLAVYDAGTGMWNEHNPFDFTIPANASQMGVANTADGVVLVQPRSNGEVGIWQDPTAGQQSNPDIRTIMTGGPNNYQLSGGASASGLNNMWVAASFNGSGRLARGTGVAPGDWSLIGADPQAPFNPVWRSVHAASDTLVVAGGQGPGSQGVQGMVAIWNGHTPQTWQEIGHWTDRVISAVYAYDPRHIWVAGIDSTTQANFLALFDGTNWTEVDTGGTGGLLSLAKDSNGNMWAVGVNGQIFKGTAPRSSPAN